MKKLRTFICTNCTFKQSRFSEDGVTELHCLECAAPAKLALSAPKYFGNSTGRSPSAVN